MAQPRYTRIDNRRPSSNYCSTVTVVVFVALCLVGIWMMTSSSVGPAQNVDEVSLDNKDGIKKQMTPPSEEGNGQKFEDASGETPNEDKKGDGDTSLPKEDESSSKQENQEENKQEKTKEESTPSGETKSETEGGEDKEDDSKSENGGGGDSNEKKDLKDNPDEENPDTNEKQTKPETEDNESGEDGENQKQFESGNSEKKSSDDDKEIKTGNEDTEKENSETNVDVQVEQEGQPKNETSGDLSPPGAQLELLNETPTQNGSFSTQATESKNEKEAQKGSGDKLDYKWALCNTTAGPDYIPCLDNVQAIRSLPSTKHYEHRERHCPDSPPTCLVPLPEGYKRPIEWPKSREKVC